MNEEVLCCCCWTRMDEKGIAKHKHDEIHKNNICNNNFVGPRRINRISCSSSFLVVSRRTRRPLKIPTKQVLVGKY